MIAAVAQSLSLSNLPFGWFDFVTAAVLVFGLFRGRKNGMTKEFLPTFLWVGIILFGGLGYQMVGQMFINIFRMDKLMAYLLGYFILMLVVVFMYLLLKHLFQAKLLGSNFFGAGEYYLGMISGFIRYFCILFFVLALLNAPFYTAAQIQATRIYNNKTYGGGEKNFSGNFFPSIQSVQEDVFKKSLAGAFLKEHLGLLLINSVPPGTDKSKPLTPASKGIITIGH